MKAVSRFERVLRWYPPNWRESYGEGMAALLEDTYGDRRLPLRGRLSLFRAGVNERVREGGWAGAGAPANDRIRAGSLSVLLGWSLFIVAGAIFAKFSEHWNLSTPVTGRSVPTFAYGLVQWSGGVGMILVGVAGLIALPSLVRFVRREGGRSIRVPLQWMLGTGALVLSATVSLGFWAHDLSSHSRNGGNIGYGLAFLAWGMLVVTFIFVGTGSATSIVQRLNLSRHVLIGLAAVALMELIVMFLVAIGVFIWWGGVTTANPTFLANAIGSGIGIASNALPPALLVAGALMMSGLLVGLFGVIRVGRALRTPVSP